MCFKPQSTRNCVFRLVDSPLTFKGLQFARALGEYLGNDELGPENAAKLCVWNSTQKSSKATAAEVCLVFVSCWWLLCAVC